MRKLLLFDVYVLLNLYLLAYSNSVAQQVHIFERWHQYFSMDRHEQLHDLKERRKEA
jgi:hypothetical protein